MPIYDRSGFGREVCATPSERIAFYADGSGTYDIRRVGEYLVTIINGGEEHGGESFAETMTRAPYADPLPTTPPGVLDWAEFMLTDRFGSCSDAGPVRLVLIDGEAYAVEWSEGVYLTITHEPTPAEAVRLVADDVRQSYPEESDASALEHVRNTIRLPEAPRVAGSYPLEEDGSPLALAYRMVLEGRANAEEEPARECPSSPEGQHERSSDGAPCRYCGA
jgi:hypothetical protein